MKLSQLRKIIKEEISRLSNQKISLNENYVMTQQEMNNACARWGHGTGVSSSCEYDPPHQTIISTCTVTCNSGAIVTTTNGDSRRHSQDIRTRGTNQQSGGYRGPEGPRAPMGPTMG